jgi:hypothetical protein
MIFYSDKIWEIRKKAIESGLQKKRPIMLIGIDGGFAAKLDKVDNESDQLLSDLNAMSDAGTIRNGQVQSWRTRPRRRQRT